MANKRFSTIQKLWQESAKEQKYLSKCNQLTCNKRMFISVRLKLSEPFFVVK